MYIKLTISVSLIFSVQISYAQPNYLPLNKDIYQPYEKLLNKKGLFFHTSVKPFLLSETADSLINNQYCKSPFKKKFLSKVWNHVINDHLLIVDTSDFYLTVDPLFNFEYGHDFADNKDTYVNTRGFWINGAIGEKFAFSSSFRENQARFVDYLDTYIRDTAVLVVPGQGRARPFKAGGFDFGYASGYISYAPSKYFNMQFGHGKNFIGNGYRSLLLSDNTFSYPFLKLTTTVWRLKYINLFTEFQDLRKGSSFALGFERKYGAFHYLNWAITNNLQIGYFEGVIWEAAAKRGFEINYLNPIIFYRPIEFSLGSPDNVIMGLNAIFKLFDFTHLYGQFILDDLDIEKSKKGKGFYRNKYGFQLGFKSYNLFKINNLFFQAEYNQVQPYTYAHKIPIQNYAHYNQPLAHPLNANFKEGLVFFNYRYKRFFGELKFIYAQYGADSTGTHFGHDIFISDTIIPNFPNSYGNFNGQGIKTTLMYNDIRLSYLINPKTNLNIEVKFSNRLLDAQGVGRSLTNFISVGIRTNLSNYYYDF